MRIPEVRGLASAGNRPVFRTRRPSRVGAPGRGVNRRLGAASGPQSLYAAALLTVGCPAMTDTGSLLDATAQAELVRRGEATPLELVDAAIARIERLDPELGSVITRQFERARALGRRARAAGRPVPRRADAAQGSRRAPGRRSRPLRHARAAARELARAGGVLFRRAPAARGPDLARPHEHARAGPAADDRARGLRPARAIPGSRHTRAAGRQRRLRGGGRRRAGGGGARERRRRLDPDSGEPLRAGGAQAHARALVVRAGSRASAGPAAPSRASSRAPCATPPRCSTS